MSSVAGVARPAMPRRLRATLLAMAGVGLVAGVWTGLVRAGWVPPAGIVDPGRHGVIMISGFFGALISLERAVALDRRWAYIAPPAAALGALGGAAGLGGAAWWTSVAALIMTLGSALLWRTQPAPHTAIMAVGSGAWLTAVLIELSGGSVVTQIPWLIGFLVLTITGERLELSRFAPPSRWKIPGAIGAVTLFGVGTIAAGLGSPGWRWFGAGLLALAVWLVAYDVARRTIRMGGVTSFIAVCLMTGYAWLAIGGAWWLIGGDLTGNLGWDGALHAVLVGFVFSMVFGHVHLVAPAVIGVAVEYRSWFFVHVVLLHASVVVRLLGDLAADPALRRWGAMGNALAIVIFVIATVIAVGGDRRSVTTQRPTAGAAP